MSQSRSPERTLSKVRQSLRVLFEPATGTALVLYEEMKPAGWYQGRVCEVGRRTQPAGSPRFRGSRRDLLVGSVFFCSQSPPVGSSALSIPSGRDVLGIRPLLGISHAFVFGRTKRTSGLCDPVWDPAPRPPRMPSSTTLSGLVRVSLSGLKSPGKPRIRYQKRLPGYEECLMQPVLYPNRVPLSLYRAVYNALEPVAHTSLLPDRPRHRCRESITDIYT